jgi:hypothetical protein
MVAERLGYVFNLDYLIWIYRFHLFITYDDRMPL